ncbi:unnamed protein product [Caenorhabditis angaria]|uniref:Exonuclease domain-containing protein n=1 Tax=Caenorhabditis angaria TaxID=860376 RepID=A0A9P1IW55_9PELO|nr:unnamed protein product [Caenorhabditis angaria]
MKRVANETPTKLLNWNNDGESTPTKKSAVIPPCVTRSSPTKSIKKRSPLIPKVNTFVFFDLETTDKITDTPLTSGWESVMVKGPDKFTDTLDKLCLQTTADQLPRITEMSFVAIPRDSFLEYQEAFKNDEKNGATKLGRYIPTNTHTRQINPNLTSAEWIQYETRRQRAPIVHKQKSITCKNQFDREWPAVIDFLNSLEKPVAIVAHNGIKFDFRVIYGEMARYKLLENHPIPKEILFVDSIAMIKQVELKYGEDMQLHCKDIDWMKIAELEAKSNSIEDEAFFAEESKHVVSDIHPYDFLNIKNWSIAKKKRISKSFFKKINNSWVYSMNDAKYQKLGLGYLFEQLVGGQFVAHYAQQDCEALMQVCITYAEDFCNFVDQNAAEFPF